VHRKVVFTPEAEADLLNLYDYIAERSGPARAIGFLDRVETYCLGFATAGERGTRRDDLRPGLRIVGFQRRLTIAFHVAPDTVVIDRIFYRGRDVAGAFSPETDDDPTENNLK
jgi:toxin ParE1/3/4